MHLLSFFLSLILLNVSLWAAFLSLTLLSIQTNLIWD
jgi:hypothetical protein